MEQLVSIITVSFNSEKTIKDTIESVLNQTYKNIEYIIVDGLSKDNTLKIARSYKYRFEERGIIYTIVSEKDNGIYDAMNKGIRLSNGHIVGMINSDDWYEQTAIEKVVDVYKETRFDYLFGDIRIVKGQRNTIKHSKYDKFYVTSRTWNHPSSFVTKNIYNKYQYRNKTIYDDFELYLRVRRDNFKIIVINEILANFRFGGISNEKNIKKTINRIIIRYNIYRQNHYSVLYIVECIFVEFLKYIIS